MTTPARYYRATFSKDNDTSWWALTFVNINYDLARDHARHFARAQGLQYKVVQRLLKKDGEREIRNPFHLI
jgi:hypothetical protein